MGTLNTSNKKYVLLYDKPKAGITLFQYQFADEHKFRHFADRIDIRHKL